MKVASSKPSVTFGLIALSFMADKARAEYYCVSRNTFDPIYTDHYCQNSCYTSWGQFNPTLCADKTNGNQQNSFCVCDDLIAETTFPVENLNAPSDKRWHVQCVGNMNNVDLTSCVGQNSGGWGNDAEACWLDWCNKSCQAHYLGDLMPGCVYDAADATQDTTCLCGPDHGTINVMNPFLPTPAPTPAPTPGGASGDPHFRTWAGEKYDFHGLCDLILLQDSTFQDGLGMDIHIRTKDIKKKWSYISNAVIQIGEDTFEVAAGNAGQGEYWMNGAAGDLGTWVNEDENISGFPISYKRLNKQSAEFVVYLGVDGKIVFSTWGKFVRVDVKVARTNLAGSRGLMGTIEGVKLGRDSKTIFDNIDEFGQEWQVLASERMLFHNKEGPQQPIQNCFIPSAVDMRRRLGETTITQGQAELACARVEEEDRDLCVFDVMATNDMGVAEAY